MIEFLISILIGILFGTITGLVPGVHINLVSVILISLIPSIAFLQTFQTIYLIIFIISMSITHTFLDFIPSIYLGAPDEDSFLSILPGHKLLKEGRGHQAVLLTLLGSLTAIPIILLFTPLFILLIPLIHQTSQKIVPYLLIFISTFLILRQKEILSALVIFLLAGFLGLAVLNLPVKEPLFPLLTGLFGISTLLISLKNKTIIPNQKIEKLSWTLIPKNEFIKTSIAAAISAPLCSFLPGIGSGHAALIGSEFFPQTNKSFLFLVGAINTIVVALSFITLYVIQKSRTGVAAAIFQLTQELTTKHLLIILLTIVLTGLISFVLGIEISKIFAKTLNKLNYHYLSISIITLLLILSVIISNPLGLIVLLTSSALGIFTILSEVRRINLMGCLIIPTIIFYLM